MRTYNVIVEPKDQAYTIFAQSMDRTGYARGTLAPRPGMTAEVPAQERPKVLTMADMMGDMGAGGSASMHSMPGMAHARHGTSMGGGAVRVRHAATEYGPSTDMRVDTPRTNLDDPGIGLRNNGRRVLTYADLRTIDGPIDPSGPKREIELHLTGNMERYIFGFNGLTYDQSQPVRYPYGQRIWVTLVNDTMMEHPIHLHGLFTELENGHGRLRPLKHTVSVKPAEKVHYYLTANELGRWAYHCHLLYHMEAGMFTSAIIK